MASLFVARLNREWHVDALMARAGKGGPMIAGMAFAIAWTPCIGPTLGAILTAASLSSSAAHGALLLAVYSAGLGIPFLVTALAFSRMTTAFAVVKRHYAVIMAIGGAILIAMGVLILTGDFFQLNIRGPEADQRPRAESLGREPAQLDSGSGAPTSTGVPTASTSSSSPPSESREQTIRKRPVPSSGSPTIGRPRISSQPRRSISNGFMRTSEAGKRAVGVVLVDRPRDRLEVLGLGAAHASNVARPGRPPPLLRSS